MALVHSPRIVTDGLVFCIDGGNPKSYPGTGTSWFDLVHTNTVTIGAGVSYTPANGGSMSYDGSASATGVISTLPSEINMTGSELTMSAWVRFAVLPAGELPVVRVTNKFQLGWQDSGTIRNLIDTNGTTGWIVDNDISYTFATGVWYNMAATYNGSNMFSYVNAELVGTATITGNIDSRTTDLFLGDFGVNELNGLFGHVAIYDKFLTADQISQNYLAFKERYG